VRLKRNDYSIRFPGQYYDAETETAGPGTGLHYNRFRYYDPALGRYISADPIGQFGTANVVSA
jgi:RHS repeat-associated protein